MAETTNTNNDDKGQATSVQTSNPKPVEKPVKPEISFASSFLNKGNKDDLNIHGKNNISKKDKE